MLTFSTFTPIGRGSDVDSLAVFGAGIGALDVGCVDVMVSKVERSGVDDVIAMTVDADGGGDGEGEEFPAFEVVTVTTSEFVSAHPEPSDMTVSIGGT
jgi:hypothetical protein